MIKNKNKLISIMKIDYKPKLTSKTLLLKCYFKKILMKLLSMLKEKELKLKKIAFINSEHLCYK